MALIDELPKTFDPHDAAERYYPEWEAAGMFSADPEKPGPAYSIVIPPPNVTGSLHMGHALNNTLQDVLIRYKRMDGYNALWVPGTDHAGIATQWVVERQLKAENLTRHDLGREAFVERIWKWKEESGGTIVHQLRKLGVSCDWGRQRFTLDAGLSEAVKEVFVRYYEQGLIYRAERLINWDPVAETALSNLEVENEENHQSEIYSFAYPLAEPIPHPVTGDVIEEIVVATTRPETMLGDTAVAVHPEDPRYKHLIGRNVRHPIVGREFPIVGDGILVDPEFGTGAVKVTPAHDFNDFEVGKRHDLPFINILNTDGTINGEGGEFEGLDRFVARKAIKKKLAELGLDRGRKDHVMALPRSQRSGAPVEPMLSTQWFVKMKPLAGPALAAVENDFTRFVPRQWENTYFAWLRDIRDWCISRQLWWGHRIPAWYDKDGNCYVARSEQDARETYEIGEDVVLTQDEDVLDTWFSSALWPFSTMGWPDRSAADLKRYYPTAVLITGFDIIFFWVARMMVSGLHFMGNVPFSDVYIHALVRDDKGQKMSKTKGNVVNPLVEIDKHGADAFRMTLVALAAQGRDILWNDNRAEGYVKFTNKIWQAFRFTAMQLKDYDPDAPRTLGTYEQWILARLGAAVGRIRSALDEYRFNDAASELYAFTWHELCDWYLELSKGTLYNDNAPEAQQGARHTLLTVFKDLVCVFHPIMPFLSEEIWQRLKPFGTEGSVSVAEYPKADAYPDDPDSLAEVEVLQQAITAIRRIRAEMDLKRSVELTLRADGVDLYQKHAQAMLDLAGVHVIEQGGREGICATAVVSGQQLFFPLEGVIDIDAERQRLTGQIEKAEKDVNALNKRLDNPRYVNNAPAHIVQESRDKLAQAQDRLDKLLAARKNLDA
ncbi:MAG: valine--tRNA ligase [Myxococcota bacterium]